MSGYVQKSADKAADCVVDWNQGYLEPGEAVEADLGWSLVPADGCGDARIEVQGVDARRSFAKVADGVPGRVYMLSARALTTMGRELERAIVLRVAQ